MAFTFSLRSLVEVFTRKKWYSVPVILNGRGNVLKRRDGQTADSHLPVSEIDSAFTSSHNLVSEQRLCAFVGVLVIFKAGCKTVLVEHRSDPGVSQILTLLHTPHMTRVQRHMIHCHIVSLQRSSYILINEFHVRFGRASVGQIKDPDIHKDCRTNVSAKLSESKQERAPALRKNPKPSHSGTRRLLSRLHDFLEDQKRPYCCN
jgi:hypothetical protein